MIDDFQDLVYRLRPHFFAKDRDVILQTGRVFSGAGGSIPIGGIVLWSGAVVDIPTGWALCDGTNGTPDLQDNFVVGAGDSYAVGDTGGANTNDLAHTHTSGGYATDNDTHSHQLDTGSSGTIAQAESGGYFSADTHNHDVTGTSGSTLSAAQENRPPYYALAYIQRLS